MSATYSIKIGTPYESKRIINIEDVLKQLPDNTNKEITPKDVRDAFLSTWSNSVFKTTVTSNGDEYIGIDSGNPADRDIKQKILLGKRQYNGGDVVNGLLSYDTDIYFYNTKLDTATQSTKISILSGTNSELFKYAPYIESQSNGLKNDLIIRNPSTYSNINIESTSGRVVINGISFPTIDETKNSQSPNNKVLRYQGTFPNGSLKWSDTNIDNLNIGTTTTETKIYGGTVSLNGFELEFYDTRKVPKTIGGVPAGMTFGQFSSTKQKWPISEVLRKLLYSYVPPDLKISVYNMSTGNNYYESGTSVNVGITYSATIHSIGLFNTNYVNSNTGTLIKRFNSNDSITSTITGGSPGSTPSTPGYNKTGTTTNTQSSSTNVEKYVFYVNDSNGTATITSSHSATASMYPIYPIYYGFTSSLIQNLLGMTSSLTKLVQPTPGANSSLFVDYKGSGYLYFCYPEKSYDSMGNEILFGTPSIISDAQTYGFNYYDSMKPQLSIFTYSATSSNSIGTYSLWRTIDKCSYSEVNKIQFKF